MITKKEAIKIAQDSYSPGLYFENGFINIYDIGDNTGYYGFDSVIEPDEEYKTSMLCVSKQDGKVSWLGGGYLYTTYDMTNIIKEPVEY